MSTKGKIKLNGQPPGLAVPKTPVKLSPRSKWRRAMQKMDKDHKHDVDAESVPLTERESLTRPNSRVASGSNSGQPSPSQIPNVVQYDAKDKGTDRPDKEVTGNTSGANETTKDFNSSGTTPERTEGSSKDLKENDSSALNGSAVKTDAKVPLSQLGNDISLKDSLTVPGKDSGTSGVKNVPDDKDRKSSVLSFGRETSKLSFDSKKSVDARAHQYTTINVPTEEHVKSSVFSPDDSMIKTAIPYMPLGVAVTCLVMNIIIPGSGTILSGVTIFCCGKTKVRQKYERDVIRVMCINAWVGVAQLFTVTFMLVGWFWSLAWGITMIMLSLEQRRELKEQRENELKRRALEAFGTSLSNRGRIMGFT